MVDVVTNHMGYVGCGDCVDYSIYTPFDSVSLITFEFDLHHTNQLMDFRNHTSIPSVLSTIAM